jgi:hypothetical protein
MKHEWLRRWLNVKKVRMQKRNGKAQIEVDGKCSE